MGYIACYILKAENSNQILKKNGQGKKSGI